MTLIDFQPLDNQTLARMLTALLLVEAQRIAALPPALTGCDDCQRRIGEPHAPTCPSDGRVVLADTLAGKGAA